MHCQACQSLSVVLLHALLTLSVTISFVLCQSLSVVVLHVLSSLSVTISFVLCQSLSVVVHLHVLSTLSVTISFVLSVTLSCCVACTVKPVSHYQFCIVSVTISCIVACTVNPVSHYQFCIASVTISCCVACTVNPVSHYQLYCCMHCHPCQSLSAVLFSKWQNYKEQRWSTPTMRSRSRHQTLYNQEIYKNVFSLKSAEK